MVFVLKQRTGDTEMNTSEAYVAFHSECRRRGLSYKVTKSGSIVIENGIKVAGLPDWAEALALLTNKPRP